MASADVEAPPADPTAGLPDYLLDPNAVMKDLDAKWRYKQPPDYTNTRKVYAQSTLSLIPLTTAFSTKRPIKLTPQPSQNPKPHRSQSPLLSRKPRQELGSRSLLQNRHLRLAHHRPP